MLTRQSRTHRLFFDDDGATAIEYAVALSLIGAVVAASVRTLGSNTTQAFSKAAASLSGAASNSNGNSGRGKGAGNGSGNGNAGGNGGGQGNGT